MRSNSDERVLSVNRNHLSVVHRAFEPQTDILEIPLDELDAHLDRYADFFEAHDITREDPLGAFRTRAIPEAPPTPDRLESGESPWAVGGYADAAYVQTAEGEVTPGGTDEPEDVDPGAVLGLDDESEE